jgi:hypothetical protein
MAGEPIAHSTATGIRNLNLVIQAYFGKGKISQGRVLRTFFVELSISGRILPAATEFYDFRIPDIRPVDPDAHQGTDLVPALFSRRTGVYMQAGQLFVVLDLEDMRMTGDEQSRFFLQQQCLASRAVPAWVAADMDHGNLYPFAWPYQVFREPVADIRSVDIPVYPPEGPECAEFFRKREVAEIPRMPDLIHIPEMMKNGVIQPAMSVGNEANSFQADKVFLIANYGLRIAEVGR